MGVKDFHFSTFHKRGLLSKTIVYISEGHFTNKQTNKETNRYGLELDYKILVSYRQDER